MLRQVPRRSKDVIVNQALIVERMSKSRLTQQDLASRWKVSAATVNYLIHGKRPYSPLMPKLALALGLSPGQLYIDREATEGLH